MPNSKLEKFKKIILERLSKPYVSEAQRRWAHTPSGLKTLGEETVKEWDKKSKGLKLPERAKEDKD